MGSRPRGHPPRSGPNRGSSRSPSTGYDAAAATRGGPIDHPADGADTSALRFTARAGATSGRTVRVFADACLASIDDDGDAEELRLVVTELLADATERGATLGLEFQPAASGWRLRVRGVGSLDAPIDPALAVSRLDVIRAVATVSPDADGLVIEPLAGQSSGP